MDQSKVYSQQRGRDVPKKEKYIPKGENADWIKSTYERRVANRGRNKGDHGFRGGQPSLDDGKHPSKCKWFNLSILANFMLALIVLSSITKKRGIVTNMSLFMPFRVILVIV